MCSAGAALGVSGTSSPVGCGAVTPAVGRWVSVHKSQGQPELTHFPALASHVVLLKTKQHEENGTGRTQLALEGCRLWVREGKHGTACVPILHQVVFMEPALHLFYELRGFCVLPRAISSSSEAL